MLGFDAAQDRNAGDDDVSGRWRRPDGTFRVGNGTDRAPYLGRRSIGTTVGDEPAWMLPSASNSCRSYSGRLRGPIAPSGRYSTPGSRRRSPPAVPARWLRVPQRSPSLTSCRRPIKFRINRPAGAACVSSKQCPPSKVCASMPGRSSTQDSVSASSKKGSCRPRTMTAGGRARPRDGRRWSGTDRRRQRAQFDKLRDKGPRAPVCRRAIRMPHLRPRF